MPQEKASMARTNTLAPDVLVALAYTSNRRWHKGSVGGRKKPALFLRSVGAHRPLGQGGAKPIGGIAAY